MYENHSAIVMGYCKNRFFQSEDKDSKKLLVMLPAVNNSNNFPYFPRISWGPELSKKYHVLYVSDPYQHHPCYSSVGGSWFISPDGVPSLVALADKINSLKTHHGLDDVLFYGSSMGGYAAIVLSSYFKGSKAVAECPQLYLNKHPGSRFVTEKILKRDITLSEIEPLYYIKKDHACNLKIICSIFDHHYSQHVLPFVEELKSFDNTLNMKLQVSLYMNIDYKKGHVALNKADAFKVIESMYSEI
jgi:hypothetical protein